MSIAVQTRKEGGRRFPPAVLGAAVVAWVVTILAQSSGKAVLFNHARLIEGVPPFIRPPALWVALPLFLLAWQLMVVAMMLPSSLPMVRLFRAASATQPRPASARGAFLAGYLLVWSGFGALAFAQDIGIHRLVDRVAWVQAHPWVIAGGALALAGAFQFSELKERCLTECRHPAAFLLQHYRRGARGGFDLGRRHGLFCLGCCWALMLVMFAAGVANLAWMAALAALMFYEKVGRSGERVAGMAGYALLALAVLVPIHPSWLPPVFEA
jgi:predicted metal-binding membrane protein